MRIGEEDPAYSCVDIENDREENEYSTASLKYNFLFDEDH